MRTIILGLALLSSVSSFATIQFSSSKASISCSSDFSSMEMGSVEVEIFQSDSGYKSYINNILSNDNGKVEEFLIEDRQTNFGNQALRAIQSQEIQLGISSDVSFKTEDVKKLVAYDLSENNDGYEDKFGGIFLFELYGENDTLLGRVVRQILTMDCK